MMSGGSMSDGRASTSSRSEAITSLEKSPVHKRQKEVWMADLQVFELEREDAVHDLRRLKTELYQIISMSILFEGVIFTGVAQTTRLNCSLWWNPVVLAVTVGVAACVGVVEKYRAIEEVETNWKMSRENIKGIVEVLGKLEEEGAGLDLDMNQATTYYLPPAESSRLQRITSCAALSTLSFLLFFSFFCRFTLCHHCTHLPCT